MVVPTSANPNEYTLITPTLSSNTPTLYTVDGATRNITPGNGDTHTLTLNSTWAPLSTTAGQPHTLTQVVSEVVEGARTYRSEIDCSNRTLQPQRWRSICTDSGTGTVYDKYWLRRGGGDPGTSGTGQSPSTGGATDINERWWERFGNTAIVAGTMQFHHNPTMSGSGDRPVVTTDPGVLAKMYTGRPYSYFVRSRQSSEVPAVIEGGCAPLDFGGDPGIYEYSDHGYGTGDTAEDQPAWWWRMRMWRRFLPNYKDMPRITRVDSGSWFPVDWNNSGVSNPVLCWWVENWDMVPRMFNTTYMIDVAAGTAAQLVTVQPLSGVTGAGFTSVHSLMRHRVLWEFSATDAVPAQGLAVAPYTPISTPYQALAYVDSVSGFCVAFATKLETCTNLDEDSRNDCMDACQMQAWQRIFNQSTTNSEISNEGDIAYVIHKSRIRRGAGWIFQRTFVYTGEYSKVVGDLQRLYQAGEFDMPMTVGDVPAAVAASIEPTTDGLTGTGNRVTGLLDGDRTETYTTVLDLGLFGRKVADPTNDKEMVEFVVPESAGRSEIAITITLPDGSLGDTMELIIEGRLQEGLRWHPLTTTQTITGTTLIKVPRHPDVRIRMKDFPSRQGRFRARVMV